METMIEQPEYMQRGFVHEPQDDTAKAVRPQRPRSRLDGSRYQTHVAWDLRFHRWLRSWWVGESDYKDDADRWAWRRRVRLWFFGYKGPRYGQYEMARKFFVAFFGGFVGKDEYEQRVEICHRCPSLRVKLPSKASGKAKSYCGSCGCANWLLSELGTKNKFRRWFCPEQRHEGPYPGGWQREYVSRLQARLDAAMTPPETGNGEGI